jgi:SAM-dependent methyltransferase
MNSDSTLPKLYTSLADWWPLVSPPSEYTEEAAVYLQHLVRAGSPPSHTLVEFGSGGGSNASHLKKHFQMTLVDLSPKMLAVSRAVNPECEHLVGDMRTVRLGREFDRVFIHDAICYLTSAEDLRKAFETAFLHCRPGGAALFVPDFVRENFRPSTSHHGYDGGPRSLRYLEWTWDPDAADNTYLVDYAYLFREAGGSVRVDHDRHVEGLFSRAEWLQLLADAGFQPQVIHEELSDGDLCSSECFLGLKPNRR